MKRIKFWIVHSATNKIIPADPVRIIGSPIRKKLCEFLSRTFNAFPFYKWSCDGFVDGSEQCEQKDYRRD